MSPIVSLNRFERKKNIEFLLHAYAYIIQQTPAQQQSSLPPLIGMRVRYTQCRKCRITRRIAIKVDFRMDISDAEQATLFQTALYVAYTPDKEHFGIAPLEPM
jgi:hypothetical protein